MRGGAKPPATHNAILPYAVLRRDSERPVQTQACSRAVSFVTFHPLRGYHDRSEVQKNLARKTCARDFNESSRGLHTSDEGEHLQAERPLVDAIFPLLLLNAVILISEKSRVLVMQPHGSSRAQASITVISAATEQSVAEPISCASAIVAHSVSVCNCTQPGEQRYPNTVIPA